MQFSSVVFPAPFGPMRPRILALVYVERQVLQTFDASEMPADAMPLEQDHDRCLRRAMLPGPRDRGNF